MPVSGTQVTAHVRKPHHKSRRGCKRCKCKRIKCDEIKPSCGSCTKYQLECEFAPISQRKRPAPKPQSILLIAPSKATSEIAPLEISQMTTTPSDRLVELKLMHHFTIICDETLFRFIEPWRLRDEKQVASRDIATRWVVGLALQDEGIMDALFAFSAFNLRRLNPNDKQLLLASHKYTARAIAAHAEQLRQETWKSNVEIVFAASLLITFIAVHNPWPENKDQLPLHWFQPWQGVRTIVRSSLESFHTHEIKKLLEVELCQKLPPPDSTTHNTTFDFLLDGLDYETTDVETVAAYEKNVKRLSIIYDHPKRDYVFKFAAKVGPRFVQLLDQKDPRAMTIVGYFFMLLKTVEEVWWLPRPSGEEFWTLVKLLPVAWRPRMWWAVKEFAAAANDKGDSVPTPCKSTCDSSLLLQADCCQLRP